MPDAPLPRLRTGRPRAAGVGLGAVYRRFPTHGDPVEASAGNRSRILAVALDRLRP
ncbi:hypothetical protein AB0M34_09030 [Nocardia sp. NPDC050193]